jgi:hypothetical protein
MRKSKFPNTKIVSILKLTDAADTRPPAVPQAQSLGADLSQMEAKYGGPGAGLQSAGHAT